MFAKFLVIAASAITAIAYTTPTTQCTDGCNPISKPGLQEAVPVGSAYTVTWQPTTAGTVTILLLRGPSTNVVPLYPIAEKVANTGTFSWTPASDLDNDVTHYGLQLINDADGTYQWSTQFGISNPGKTGGSSSSSAISISGSASLTAAPSSSPTAVYNSSVSVSSSSSESGSYPTTYYSNSSSSAAASSSAVASSTFTSIAAATTAASKTTASTSAKPSSGAAQMSMSIGGAVVAFVAAIYAL